MIEFIWYIALAIGALVIITNWRAGISVAIVADCLRDPVRKLTDEEPILITLSGSALWILLVVIALAKEKQEISLLISRYPRLRAIFSCLLIALLPAAGVSCLMYSGGWKLAAVGMASYMGPLLGIAVGYALARSEREIYRIFVVYSVANAVLLIGVPLEYFGADIDGLGGLKGMEWVRHQPGYVVNLIAGFYRSPDIMGLHAAHVVMFSAMMSLRSKSFGRFGWLMPIAWASYCILLCGRRKMVGIPLVFLAAFIVLSIFRGTHRFNRVLTGGVAATLIGIVVLLAIFDQGDSSEYTDYASTIFTEGVGRANELIIGSSIVTMQQVGILGGGLGTATQGRYYVNVANAGRSRAWQEDGVSRVLMEFGVPGAILMIVAVVLLMFCLRDAVWLVDRNSSVQLLQMGALSVVIANAASFAISHQQYSGDPISALFATILAGIVMGAPRIFAHEQAMALHQITEVRTPDSATSALAAPSLR